MKNLKKVLALGLALIMLMSMFTVASAAEAKVATELTDWDSIAHQNAVALNVDLGIIKGMPDGSYKPTENIDRASWAKLAYVAACGDEDADAYLGTVTGLKDIAGNWAESYISYLAANSYISGDETGNYNPSNNVTVVEACKTMLTILGYNAKDRGYENNAAWSGKIMSDAKANGLMDGVDKEQTALKPLTRENAAQIIYNALAAQTVEEEKTYDAGNQYVARYDKDVPLGYKVFNLIKLEGIVNSIETDGTVNFSSLKPIGVSSEFPTVNTGKVNKYVGGDVADVGQLCTVFVKGVASFNTDNNVVSVVSAVDELVSANVAPSDTLPLLTVTKGANFQSEPSKVWNVKDTENYVGVDCEVDKDTSKPDPTKIKFYVNGNENDDTNAAAGDIAKLYDTDNNGKVDTISIVKYQVAKITGAVRTQKDSANKDTVLIPGVTAGFIPVSQVKGPYASLKQDDVVLYYTNSTGRGQATSDMVVTVEIPETVTGKITRVDSKGRSTVNGSVYPASGIFNSAHTATAMNSWNDFENEYTFYLDKNGGLCYNAQNTDAAVAGNVAVVLESRWISGGTIDASNYLQAKLMLADGDVVISPIDRVGVNTAAEGADVNIVMCTPTDKATDTSDKKVNYTEYAGLDATDGFWSYRVNASGHYELTPLTLRTRDFAGTFASMDTVANTIKVEKKPNFLVNGTAPVDGYSADSDTVFMVEKYNASTDTSTFEVYNGHTNVPAMNAGTVTTVAAISAKDSSGNVIGAAKYVYLRTTSYADDLPEGLVFRVDGENGRDAENYTIEVLDPKTGARTTLVVDSLSYVNDKLEMYTVDAISDGVVTAMSKVTTDDADKGLTVGTLQSIGRGVVTSAEGKSFQYDNSTICILIDLKVTDANGTTLSSAGVIDPASGVDMDEQVYADGTKLYVIADKEDLASYIYVVRTMKQS